jgi:hypothetical protein
MAFIKLIELFEVYSSCLIDDFTCKANINQLIIDPALVPKAELACVFYASVIYAKLCHLGHTDPHFMDANQHITKDVDYPLVTICL